MDLVRAGAFLLGVVLHDHTNSAVARHHLVDQAERARLCGGQRNHGLREDDGAAQRQDWEQ